jgi:hypothetical protein
MIGTLLSDVDLMLYQVGQCHHAAQVQDGMLHHDPVLEVAICAQCRQWVRLSVVPTAWWP